MIDIMKIRCGVVGCPKVGDEINHPVYGLIRVTDWFGYACGESLIEAERLNPTEPTLIDLLKGERNEN